MGENIKFQRTHAQDMYEDEIEYHGYEEGANLVALALIGGSLVVVAVGIVGMLLILWN